MAVGLAVSSMAVNLVLPAGLLIPLHRGGRFAGRVGGEAHRVPGDNRLVGRLHGDGGSIIHRQCVADGDGRPTALVKTRLSCRCRPWRLLA